MSDTVYSIDSSIYQIISKENGLVVLALVDDPHDNSAPEQLEFEETEFNRKVASGDIYSL